MVWLDESEYAGAVVLASMVLAPEGLAPFVVQYEVFFFERTEERRGRYRVSEGGVVTHFGVCLGVASGRSPSAPVPSRDGAWVRTWLPFLRACVFVCGILRGRFLPLSTPCARRRLLGLYCPYYHSI